jgi:chemotaxis protein CheD
VTNIQDIIKVGIADMNIVKCPQKIRTTGLGSCVGVVLYDESKCLAGMAHIMLPDSSLARNSSFKPAKYADTALTELVQKLRIMGARPSYLRAKIAGGAQMFQFSTGPDKMRIGPRNVEAVKCALSELRIKIISEDTGGGSGRSIEFDPRTSELLIRTVNKGTMCI